MATKKITLEEFKNVLKTFIKEEKGNIRLGKHYRNYIDGISFNSQKITPKKQEYKESYLISNKENSPVFKGILNVLGDGRAIFVANYTTYSGVKNRYVNYFDKDGLEIIHKEGSTREEKKYFDNL
jgi:hypothetical protein